MDRLKEVSFPEFRERLHSDLIGKPHSRSMLETPALVLDLDALEGNIADMAAYAHDQGIALRPHAKSHKNVSIARRQVALGAAGICCATVSEAEAFLKNGMADVLITSPLAGNAKFEHLAHLLGYDGILRLATDSIDALKQINAIGDELGLTISIVVDIDPGMKRTGVASVADTLAMVRFIEDASNLQLHGVQYYDGMLQHVEARSERVALLEHSYKNLQGHLTALRDELGIVPGVVTGGGTGSFATDVASGLFTELQVGSYIFMDAQYNAVEQRDTPDFKSSLFVQMTVISANHPEQVTVDAGLKHLAFDGGAPTLVRGVPDGSEYAYTGDEHGAVTVPDGTSLPLLGRKLEGVVPHCDPTVNLFRYYHCVRGETLVDIWPIEAAGRL